MQMREAARLFRGTPVSEGAGVRLMRVFGGRDLELFDPFLLFDDFSSHREEDYRAGFPWHPHRGIETVTYILGGEVAHRDSIGNEGSIGPGSVQWMSAGSGIIHEEMPVVGGKSGSGKNGIGESGGGIRGFQLWVNLPKAAKMSAPAYRDVLAGTIPEIDDRGARVRVIAGKYGGAEGAASGIAGSPTYLDVALERGASFALHVAAGDTALVYVFEGRAALGTQRAPVPAGTLAVTGPGDILHVEAPDAAPAGASAARFLVLVGTPLREAVAWHGPIVMNEEAEIREALAELREGTFIKTKR
jgi:redox-sensitive bicupin YhaK (pirin superfamily)